MQEKNQDRICGKKNKKLVDIRKMYYFCRAEEKANSGIVQYFPFAVKFFRKERLQLTRFSVRNKQC